MPPKPVNPNPNPNKEKKEPDPAPEETPSNWSLEQKQILRKLEYAGREVKEVYELAKACRRDPSKVDSFRGRISLLDRYYQKFEQHMEEMYDLNFSLNPTDVGDAGDEAAGGTVPLPYTEYPDARQVIIMSNVKTWYLECLEIKESMDRADVAQAPHPAMGPNVTLSEMPSASSLPKLNLPRFSGLYDQWPQFRDAYRSMVHESTALTPIQKFHYLIGVLSGPAKAVISSYSITENNYAIAYNSLVQTYENPRILSSVYLNKLFNLALTKGSNPAKPTKELYKTVLTEVCDTISAFKLLTIPNPADFVLFSLAIKCLDQHTREQFELTVKRNEFPTVSMLTEFIRNRQIALQLADPISAATNQSSVDSKPPGKQGAKPNRGQQPKTSLLTNSSSQNGSTTFKSMVSRSKEPKDSVTLCVICKGSHGLLSCPEFHFMSPVQRHAALKSFQGCFSCLSARHATAKCPSKHVCRMCKSKQHNTLLCTKPTQSAPNTGPSEPATGTTLSSQQAESSAPQAEPEFPESQVVLGTAWVQVRDARGQLQKVRMVLDSASQFSYITHRCLLRLGLKLQKSPRKIACLGGVLYSEAKGVTSIDIQSPLEQSALLNTQAVVVKTITSYLPTVPIPTSIRKKYSKYNLADSRFYQPAPIDLLLGADLFPCVVDGTLESVGDDLPKLLGTIFGYVVIGKYGATQKERPATSLISFQLDQGGETFDLQQFWEMEEIPPENNASSSHEDEDRAEHLFLTQHYRLPDGRFGVRLPFKSEVPDLSASASSARRRFYGLEAKFKANPGLKSQYQDFMTEYRKLGHMSPTTAKSRYVIPHHPVWNRNKIRVVFDGSCPTTNGSLNSHLLPGRPLQNDIRNILLSFRAQKYAFTADAVKMYRMIEIAQEDRVYQHIFWRDDPSQALQCYQLNTVTYGLTSSPFHALRCIQVLREECADAFPLASKALEKHIYVDDIVTGSSSLPEALELQSQLIAVMGHGGFQLAKWASNSPEIMSAVAQEPPTALESLVDLSDQQGPTIKVLGLRWNPVEDVFSYQIEKPTAAATKRGILSTAARIFDPLGFLSPVILPFKTLIQQLWLAEITWDQVIPDPLLAVWNGIISELEILSQVRIPRWVLTDQPYSCQLFGFSDASEAAYSAVIYVRVQHGGTTTVHLLTSKTKVAPTKRVTIPRLELSGAVLLSRLMHSVQPFMDSVHGTVQSPAFFTDSMIVLAWMRLPPHRLKAFVANRVSLIQTLTDIDSWRHIAGKDNPSDVASRGTSPSKLLHHPLWWSGPDWLHLEPELWPTTLVEQPANVPEIKRENGSTSLLSASTLPSLIDWMTRFSSYRRLIRVVALIIRIVYNRRNPQSKRDGEYLLVEIVQAFYACVKAVQLYHFFHGGIRTMHTIEKKYQSLSPFLDAGGILRVGGRLHHANLPFNHKHQVLLPHDSHFSTLMIDHYHKAYLHAGPGLLQAFLHTRVWIPGLRRLVRTRVRKCVPCYKGRASAVIPQMGSLPHSRISPGRVFQHVGIDFAGPFIKRDGNRRNSPTSKVYLGIFVCMATRAIHLEAVSSLSTEAFLASFKRFISRRGLPTNVYSDNGTNFVGASKELKALGDWYQDECTQRDIAKFCTAQHVQWHFNPPYTPHFGGLWEAGVRSVKTHLRHVLSDTPLTYEELATIFCQIEAVLNSRPLVPLSDDPNESDYLSPGHFLIGQPLITNPEPTLLDVKLNSLSRWQLTTRFTEEIWARWRREFLSTLQKRVKWHRDPSQHYLEVGDLVLLKTKDAPVLSWPTARITATFPGSDNKIRVVTVKTPTGTYTRSAANVIPLLPTKSDAYVGVDDQPLI